VASEIAENLPILLRREGRRHLQSTLYNIWAEVSRQITDSCNDAINRIARNNFTIGFDAFNNGKISLAEFIQYHGVQGLFRDRFFYTFDSMVISIAELALYRLQIAINNNLDLLTLDKYITSKLEEIGRILLTTSTPWIKEKALFDLDFIGFGGHFAHFQLQKKKKPIKRNMRISTDAIFGGFALVAMRLESDEGESLIPDKILKLNGPLFEHLRSTFLARFKPIDSSRVNNELRYCRFSLEQQNFIWRWIKKQLDFTLIVNVDKDQVEHILSEEIDKSV